MQNQDHGTGHTAIKIVKWCLTFSMGEETYFHPKHGLFLRLVGIYYLCDVAAPSFAGLSRLDAGSAFRPGRLAVPGALLSGRGSLCCTALSREAAEGRGGCAGPGQRGLAACRAGQGEAEPRAAGPSPERAGGARHAADWRLSRVLKAAPPSPAAVPRPLPNVFLERCSPSVLSGTPCRSAAPDSALIPAA